jgi:hypothetical protein
MNRQNADEDEDEKQPPRKMIKTVRGQERKYQFLKTVKSVDELDHIRFEVLENIWEQIICRKMQSFIGNGFFDQYIYLGSFSFSESGKMTLDPKRIYED